MQECENPPPPFHSGLPWMDGPKREKEKKRTRFILPVCIVQIYENCEEKGEWLVGK